MEEADIHATFTILLGPTQLEGLIIRQMNRYG